MTIFKYTLFSKILRFVTADKLKCSFQWSPKFPSLVKGLMMLIENRKYKRSQRISTLPWQRTKITLEQSQSSGLWGKEGVSPDSMGSALGIPPDSASFHRLRYPELESQATGPLSRHKLLLVIGTLDQGMPPEEG